MRRRVLRPLKRRILRPLKRQYFKRMRKFVNRSFLFWQRLGFHVSPVHYYQPIPDTRLLDPDLWERRSSLVGVDMRPEAQLALLRQFGKTYGQECREFTGPPRPGRFDITNRMFGPVDAEMLYCMVRHHKPRNIIEIGSGHSTLLSAEALARNAEDGHPGALIAYEPHPRRFLRDHPGIEVRKVPGEQVPPAEIEALEAGDILFIDSTHTIRIGGDVQHEYRELVPRLPPGALVHIHDIFLPGEYPRHQAMRFRRFWTEQYLVQAFLAFNSDFEVLWAANYMSLDYPDDLRAAFPTFTGERPASSLWLRRLPAE
jgi:predicted O-methyltransferase YrrM